MRRLLGILAAFAVVVIARQIMPPDWGGYGEAAMALGFVLLVSFLVGQGAARIKLPSITGYILVGMIFGPHLVGSLPGYAVLNNKAVSSLQLLDAIALGLIALTAGGELRWSALRENARGIGAILVGQSVLTMGGVTIAVVWVGGQFGPLAGFSSVALLATALLFGVTALANSPATALAIIQECRSQGPVTQLVLAVTVAKDVLVISLFTITLAVVFSMTGAGGAEDSGFHIWGVLLWEVLGSISVGVLLGLLVIQYMKRMGGELPLVILGLAFFAVAILPQFHLSGLLTCMVAGFVIENYSSHGEKLIRAIEQYALPIYVVFFTIAGASLDLGALAQTWPLAVFLAGIRLFGVWMGTTLGARIGGTPSAMVKFGWSGYVAQAGVTLGFAILIGRTLPEIGPVIQTVLLAVIALNQIMGPLAFRLGLAMAGEIKEGDLEEEGLAIAPSAKERPVE